MMRVTTARNTWWWLQPLLLASLYCVSTSVDASTDADTATCRRVDWATTSHASFAPLREANIPPTAAADVTAPPPVHLLIGVKTSVVYGRAARRAIRATWANRTALPANVRIVFLGCAPDLSHLHATDAARIHEAIATERRLYDHDLLVDDLVDCRDAYGDLVNNVLAFFQWSAKHETATSATNAKSYVMVTDDDIYLRVGGVLELLKDPETPARRFYAGQVWATQFRHAIQPQRGPPTARYYLARDQYAMDQLPPFANGPHYLLSTDVAHFVGEHRAFFRGVGGDPIVSTRGSFDDVSVALWMLAMQIHPQHLARFINLRDTMCRNDFVSFADLVPDALYHIHDNVRTNAPPCTGFSYETWLKTFAPTRTAQHERDDFVRLELWNTLAMSSWIKRTSHLDDISISLEVGFKERETPHETAITTFYAATSSFYYVCEHTADHIADKLGVLAGQPVFLCEQIRRTLLEHVLTTLSQSPRDRSVLALLTHNLGNVVVVPLLKVAVATTARHALIVLENLLVQAYAGMELQVFDEATYANWTGRDPDVVVVSTSDATTDEAARDMIHSYLATYTSRIILLHPCASLLVGEPLPSRVVLVAASRVASSASLDHVYLPVAAMAFGSTNTHSPVDLLTPFDARTPQQQQSSGTTGNATATATSAMTATVASLVRLRHFCVDDYAPHECERPHRDYFFHLLTALDRVDRAGTCPHHDAASRLPNHTLAEHITTRSPFYLDQKVRRYKHFKFTIAFDDAVSVAGHVGDTIVAAFLAGSIPIYYGHSATVSHLFNTKAFIDCGSFPSLRGCAQHVLAVHSSPSLYAAMRREAPIVNVTALVEAFSWHPDVVEMVAQGRAADPMATDLVTQSEQFKILLDSAT